VVVVVGVAVVVVVGVVVGGGDVLDGLGLGLEEGAAGSPVAALMAPAETKREDMVLFPFVVVLNLVASWYGLVGNIAFSRVPSCLYLFKSGQSKSRCT
jgi:hypothetical protein